MQDKVALPPLDAKPRPSIESMHNSSILMHFLVFIYHSLNDSVSSLNSTASVFRVGKGVFNYTVIILRSVNVAASSEEKIALNDRKTDK